MDTISTQDLQTYAFVVLWAALVGVLLAIIKEYGRDYRG